MEYSKMTRQECCSNTEKYVDSDLFYYAPLPIISGHFTLREALPEYFHAICPTPLDTPVSTFENTICSHLYVLSFGDTDTQIFVCDCICSDKASIDDIYLDNIEQSFKNLPKDERYMKSELLLGLRMRLSNGDICDVDGLRMPSDNTVTE
jgi:hypothetical protein